MCGVQSTFARCRNGWSTGSGIVLGDGSLSRKSHEDALGSLGEHAGLRVTVKKASQYFSGS